MPVLKPEVKSLAEVLDAHTVEGELYQKLDRNRVRCYACGHRCLILEGQRGICQVRFNQQGRLMVPWGYVAALECDPIEKKPYNHLLPGSRVATFGMLGCDYHCSYCQNWLTSQALRDPVAGVQPRSITSEEMVDLARRTSAEVVASSYNEPLITSEWAVGIFRQARGLGVLCAYVSNGNATPQVLDYLRPWLDGFKVDLKSMSDRTYRRLGGVLQRVLDTIRMAYERGFWVEVVTLVVPGFNDSEEELREAARFLASVSKDIPWHVTAFYREYKMTDHEDTDAIRLKRAATMGKEEGLRYVYAGNLPGQVGAFEHTFCPGCNARLIERFGYRVLSYRLTQEGACPECRAHIPGIWWGRGQRPLYNAPEPQPRGAPAFVSSGGPRPMLWRAFRPARSWPSPALKPALDADMGCQLVAPGRRA
ncbi:MAG: AmmeMemoRadiSam system radical SAM enzyme [Dehalococcoidia bacterium]